VLTFHEEYIVDENGRKKSVVIPVSEWEKVLEAMEELDDIRAYDEAKSRSSEPIPFEQAVEEIRTGKSN
jgi:PHD/YefM family antitoxin component YafN of YafNO toxin-antitoxin module